MPKNLASISSTFCGKGGDYSSSGNGKVRSKLVQRPFIRDRKELYP